MKIIKKLTHTTLCVLLFLSMYLILFPTKAVTIDENNYYLNAKALLNGAPRLDCSNFSPGFFEVNNYCIYKYNIGTSIILLPFLALPTQFIFLAPLLAVVVSILVFSKILKLLNLKEYFVYFFAFHPSVIYISRTILSETFSMLFLLLIFLILLKCQKSKMFYNYIFVGIFVGITVIIRYTNIIPVVGIFLYFLYQNISMFKKYEKNNSRENQLKTISDGFFTRTKIYARKFVFFLKSNKVGSSFLATVLGGLPFLVFFLWFNNYTYGAPFRSGYFFSGEEKIALDNFFSFLTGYIFYLNLLYPLMLLISFTKIYRGMIALPSLLLIVFYSTTPNSLFTGEIVKDAIYGTRFIIPTLGFLLLSYFSFFNLNKIFNKKIVLWPIITILITSGFLISFAHQNFLLNEASDQYSSVIFGK